MWKFTTLIGSPFFIALLVTALILPFIPDAFENYKAELIEREGLYNPENVNKNEVSRFYSDIDQDGISERVRLWIKEKFSSVQIKDQQGGLLDQINIPPPRGLMGVDPLEAVDVDGDSVQEIFCFPKKADSLFLQRIDPFEKEVEDRLDREFIDTIAYPVDGEYQGKITGLKGHDLDGDGKGELAFSLMTSFCLQPRNFYLYEEEADSIRRSPKSGAHFNGLTFFDLTGNGKKELLPRKGSAYGNIPPELSMPYRDTSAWAMVFDRELNFLFDPVEFPGFKSYVGMAPFRVSDRTYLAVLYQYKGKRDKGHKLQLYDSEGKKVRERVIESQKKDNKRQIFHAREGKRLYMKDLKGTVKRLNEELEVLEELTVDQAHIEFLARRDLDGEGERELLFKGADEQILHIVRNDLSHVLTIDVPSRSSSLHSHHLSLRKNEDDPPRLSVQNGPQWYLYEYRFNLLSYMEYGVYGGVYLFSLLFVIGIQKIATYKLERDKEKLERTVKERTAELQWKNEQLEEKNRSIQDSIDYAQKIQYALLQTEEYVSPHLPEHFILFKPQSQVSGDFYWGREHKGHLYLAAVDCTGHGVPGAFMSMLGISQLNEIMATDELLTPGAILTELRERVVRELSGSEFGETAKDGMDVALLRIPLDEEGTKTIAFAGAQNPLYVIRKGIAEHPLSVEGAVGATHVLPDGRVKPFKKSPDGIEIKGDPMPVGYDEYAEGDFTTVSLQVQKGDMLYIFSDGYADQFGGPKGKKFRYGPFKQLLARLHEKPLDEQKRELDRTFEEWKEESEQEQIDDVVIMGVRL